MFAEQCSAWRDRLPGNHETANLGVVAADSPAVHAFAEEPIKGRTNATFGQMLHSLVALYVIYRILSMYMGIYAPLLQE